MDLLACIQCGDRFYAPGAWHSDMRDCPHCGGGLRFSLRNMVSIPLDARGIDHAALSRARHLRPRAQTVKFAR
jgi:hypothetical protein